MDKHKFEGIIIVSDMDGTFFGSGARVLEKNVRAIENFKANGGRFTFSTGRTHYNITNGGEGVPQLCNCPAISANGSCIYDFSKGKVVKQSFMDNELVVEAIRYARKILPDIGARCSTTYGFITDRLEGLIKKDIAEFKGGRVDVKPLEAWTDEGILKLVFRAEAEQLAHVRGFVEKEFLGKFEFASSSPRFFELNSVGCSKADGIKFLRGLYPNCKIYAVGDYENDLEMLKSADVAVCPNNALDIVKEHADIVVCDCNEGAISELIEIIAHKENNY